MRYTLLLILTFPAFSQITVARNTINDMKMRYNAQIPQPDEVTIGGTGSTLSASCTGTGCTYAAWEFCAVGSSPCTPTTSAPSYIGIKVGDVFDAGSTFVAPPGTYPISLTLSSASGCAGTCTISFNFIIYGATYPTYVSFSGSYSGCTSGGSLPTYYSSPNGELDTCSITDVRPGGAWDMPTFGNSKTDPQFGGVYRAITGDGRVICGDSVTGQFNSDASLVCTQSITSGILYFTKTDGTGDLYQGLPSGSNSWDPVNPNIFYYLKSASPDVYKVTLNGCGSPPCGSAAWTETLVYSLPGGTSTAIRLTNGGDGAISKDFLWPLYTLYTTLPEIILLNVKTGVAVYKTLVYEDVPLLAPKNGASGSAYYKLILGISNTTPPVVTVSDTSGLTSNQTVFIRDSDISAYNNTWRITVIDSTHFSIPTTASGTGGAVGESILWSPRLITGAKGNSLDGRRRMILGTYPGGSNYILSWAVGDSNITLDGPVAALPGQVYGTNHASGNSFYDGRIPNQALCDAGYCMSSWHMDTVTGGDGDAYLVYNGGVQYPTVVHQQMVRLSNPLGFEDADEGGGARIDFGAGFGQQDQHLAGARNVSVVAWDNDGDTPSVVAWKISGATNASPIVITTTTNYTGANGDILLINGVLGNTAANGLCTVANLSGASFECAGTVGSGTYTANTGSLVKNATPTNKPFQMQTFLGILTNANPRQIIVKQMYIHRSCSINDRLGSNYYGQPHLSLSDNAEKIAFESNNCIPDNYAVYVADTGFSATDLFTYGGYAGGAGFFK